MMLHAIIAESKNRRLRFAKIHALVVSSSLQRSATETPAEIVGKLNNEINAALTDPELNARLADLVFGIKDLRALSALDDGPCRRSL
jgi:hypothetical protein